MHPLEAYLARLHEIRDTERGTFEFSYRAALENLLNAAGGTLDPAVQGAACMDDRRKRLGMSRALVASRSGVSLPTVTRILTGKETAPSLPKVQAIAAALGVSLHAGAVVRVEEDLDAEEFRRRQALAKARRLVRIVQGTMGLESQAVDARTLHEMIERTTKDLLAGPRRRLWED
jgi:transcriptional regulator with XRE-family HTH domain